jgi:mannose-1-phosphate guanylyltransferase
VVLYESEFMRFIHRALRFATQKEALVTLGIRPTRPDTGYGYIQYEGETEAHHAVYKVKQFTEKPNLETATHFVASGQYLWNAGIFIWSTKSLIKAFETYAPDIAQIFEKGKLAFNTPAEKDWLHTYYPTTRATSIDYAIMEPAKNVYTIPSAFGWSDLGTWASLHAETQQNTDNNVIIGDVITDDVTNSLIRMPVGKLAILRGLDDFIIVDEEDVLLIYPKSKEQDIKKVTQRIKEEKGSQYL